MKKKTKKRSPEEISASAKENILAQLNSAGSKTEYPHLSGFPDDGDFVFPVPGDLLQVFTDELKEIGGEMIIAENERDAISRINELTAKKNIKSLFCYDDGLIDKFGEGILENDSEKFSDMEAAITRCEALVARSGTVVVSSALSGRKLNVFPPVHIIWAEQKQLVPFISDAMVLLKKRYGNDLPSQVTFVTGPSRTADIEKTLVMGAHGPRELIVVLIKNS